MAEQYKDAVSLVVFRGRKLSHYTVAILYRVSEVDDKGKWTTRYDVGDALDREDARRLGLVVAWDTAVHTDRLCRDRFIAAKSRNIESEEAVEREILAISAEEKVLMDALSDGDLKLVRERLRAHFEEQREQVYDAAAVRAMSAEDMAVDESPPSVDNNPTPPQVAFAVEYIEVEFGERPEGYVCFLSAEEAWKRATADAETGRWEGGYCGPRQPIGVQVVPWADLPENVAAEVLQKGVGFTERTWRPKS